MVDPAHARAAQTVDALSDWAPRIWSGDRTAVDDVPLLASYGSSMTSRFALFFAVVVSALPLGLLCAQSPIPLPSYALLPSAQKSAAPLAVAKDGILWLIDDYPLTHARLAELNRTG